MRLGYTFPSKAKAVACGVCLLLLSGCANFVQNRDPRVRNAPEPEYPPLAVEQGEEGVLSLLLRIEEDGSVGEVTVNESTGSALLDEAGLRYANHLSFDPAIRDGKPTSAWVEQKVVYRLDRFIMPPEVWARETRELLRRTAYTPPDELPFLLNRIYTECAYYAGYVAAYPEADMTLHALRIASPEIRKEWKPVADAFPLSFLMFADYLERFEDAPLREHARQQLIACLDLDIRRVEEHLRAGHDGNRRELLDQLRSWRSGLAGNG